MDSQFCLQLPHSRHKITHCNDDHFICYQYTVLVHHFICYQYTVLVHYWSLFCFSYSYYWSIFVGRFNIGGSTSPPLLCISYALHKLTFVCICTVQAYHKSCESGIAYVQLRRFLAFVFRRKSRGCKFYEKILIVRIKSHCLLP